MGTSLPQAVTPRESGPWEQARLIWLELGLTRFQTWWQPLTLPGRRSPACGHSLRSELLARGQG